MARQQHFGLASCVLPALLAALLLAGCETDRDPRAGGFIEGVSNLSTGGYDSYVGERRARLKETQDESNILEARARSITAEKEALDRELQDASNALTRLQARLRALQRDLDAKRLQKGAERHKLEEAQKKAAAARAKVNALRTASPVSVDAQRESIDDLKALIGSVAAMVKELSG